MNWYLKAWKNCLNFYGRASREEFWMFFLFNVVITAVLAIVEGFFRGGQEISQGQIGAIYQLASLIPTYTVGVRRMHDTDHSGWFLLIPLVNLVFLVTEGTRGDNIYGSDPKWL